MDLNNLTTEQMLMGAAIAGLLFVLYRKGYVALFLAKLKGAASTSNAAVRATATALVPSATTALLETENSTLEKQLADLQESRRKAALERNDRLRAEVAKAQEAIKASAVIPQG